MHINFRQSYKIRHYSIVSYVLPVRHDELFRLPGSCWWTRYDPANSPNILPLHGADTQNTRSPSDIKKGKVKCTLVQALRFCTGCTAHRGSRGLLSHDRGTRRGWGVSVTPWRYPLYRRLGGPQGRSEQVRKTSPPTRIRSPDRPARSQSLYQLSCPAHHLI